MKYKTPLVFLGLLLLSATTVVNANTPLPPVYLTPGGLSQKIGVSGLDPTQVYNISCDIYNNIVSPHAAGRSFSIQATGFKTSITSQAILNGQACDNFICNGLQPGNNGYLLTYITNSPQQAAQLLASIETKNFAGGVSVACDIYIPFHH
jgi:hypothetical protein